MQKVMTHYPVSLDLSVQNFEYQFIFPNNLLAGAPPFHLSNPFLWTEVRPG
jgi:hypothetical protein